MKILVSGANGFIGKHFLDVVRDRLESDDITVAGKTKTKDLTDIKFIKADFLIRKDIEKIFNEEKYDVFYHFAWVSNPGENLNSDLNRIFFLNTTYAISLFYNSGGKVFVGMGSCFEYDNSYVYCSETTPLKSNNLYEYYKIETFNYLKNYAEKNEKKYIWARIFNVFGNGEHPQRLFPYIVEGITNSEKVFCRQSSTVKDYMYVIDTVKAIYELVFKEATGVFNICSGKGVTLYEFCNEINRYFNFKGDISYLNENTSRLFQIGDNKKISMYYKPEYNIETGIIDALKRRFKLENR